MEQGASGAELQRARGEVAVLGDRLARAQAEADACRRQLRDAEAGRPPLLLSCTLYTGVYDALPSRYPRMRDVQAALVVSSGDVLHAHVQAGHAAKEQQAADRLAAAQRDIGDLQVSRFALNYNFKPVD